MQLWKCFLVGALVVLGLCSEARTAPTNDDEYMQGDDGSDYPTYDDETSAQERASSETNQVTASGPTTLGKAKTSYQAYPGENVSLACPVNNLGGSIVMWYKGDNIVTQDRSYMGNHNRYKLTNDWSLVIQSIERGDEGSYTCKIVPANLELKAKLLVIHSPEIRIIEGNRDVTDHQLSFRGGDQIRLDCMSSDAPQPKFIWSLNGNRLENEHGVVVDKGTLIIEKAQPHHSDVFQCLAENNQGLVTHKTVSIHVDYAPVVKTHKAEINVADGATKDLHCFIRASPAARIHWTRHGRILANDEKYHISTHPHDKHHHNVTTLRVKQVNKDDLGGYLCHAENIMGKAETTVALIYEPEVAALKECKIMEDLSTVQCQWEVNSAQSVSEAHLYYKHNGDRQWQQATEQAQIEKQEDGVWMITNNVVLKAGMWHLKLKTRNSAGHSKFTPDHEFNFPELPGKVILKGGIGNGSSSLASSSRILGVLLVLVTIFTLRRVDH